MFTGKYMTEQEVVTDYLQAKDRKGQIKILSQLNVCTESDICDILQSHGIELNSESPNNVDSAPKKRGRKPSTPINNITTPQVERIELTPNDNKCTTFDDVQEYIMSLNNMRSQLMKQLDAVDKEVQTLLNLLYHVSSGNTE